MPIEDFAHFNPSRNRFIFCWSLTGYLQLLPAEKQKDLLIELTYSGMTTRVQAAGVEDSKHSPSQVHR